MKQTIVEKIIASHAGLAGVRPGEIVDVSVDRLLLNDFVGPSAIAHFGTLGVDEVARPDRVLFAPDHFSPPAAVRHADGLAECRAFCKRHGLDGFLEIGRHGIGHQVMCESFTRPGEIAVGTDSHATMYGGLGALACGVNASDAAVIMATGKMWMMAPESCLVTLEGRPRRGVTAKDIALALQTLAPVDHFIYKAIEFRGEYAHEMSVSSRLTIANMICETGAKCGIFPSDSVVAGYLGAEETPLSSDPDAEYAERYTVDLDKLEPMLACPHSVNNVKPLSGAAGKPVHQAFLGSCTNGRLEDFEQAAEILRGRKVHPDVRLLIVPASQKVFLEMTRRGLTELFTECGAAILTTGCAACTGEGQGVIGAGEVCLSTTNRNWKGRMGSPDSEVYLGSAYAVAASAVAGAITPPERYLREVAR